MPADAAEIVRLASLLEKATGPDRELDARIWCALRGYRYKDHFEAYGTALTQVEYTRPPARRREVTTGIASRPHAAAYTASLDAAMTLVPEGWAVERLSAWPASPEGASNQSAAQSSVTLCGTSVERMGRRMIWGHGGRDGRVDATAATPALALTAAALRARAQHDHEVG